MSNKTNSNLSRRTFVRRGGMLAGGILLGAEPTAVPAAEPAHEPKHPAPNTPPGELPRRVLGRTGVPVTTLALGTAPCGKRPPREIADLVNAALDEGIRYVDTSEKYGNSQEGVGLGLGRRRKDVFLATKVFANSIKEAERSISTSFKLLKTDCFDLLYYHGLGCLNIEGAMDPDGVFTWLVKQKKAGKCRFLGVSAHKLPARCAQFIESGEVDVLMTLANFVDRHTYGFEEKVFPLARKHNLGIVAMKVFGGIRSKPVDGKRSRATPQLDAQYLELAIRYVLSMPGVAVANIGAHNAEQVRQNVQWVKNFRPLAADEETMLASLGRRLAAQWGEHLGPVVET